jgi:AraC-like DNA-binding protein
VADGSSAPSRQTVPVNRFSSARYRPDERYSAWREGSPLSFGRLYETKPLGSFSAETTFTQLGPVGFGYSRMTSQHWARTPRIIRGDEADPLMVNIRFAGDARGETDGRTCDAPAGSIALADFTRPQSFVSEACSSAVLAIPRALAEQRFGDVRALGSLVIPPAAATLLRSHALALARALDAGVLARQAPGLGRIALDLLEIGIGQSRPTRPVSREAAATGVRLAAEAAIRNALGPDALTVDSIARQAAVSRSTLYRVFEPDGGVQAFIIQRRLERVAAELRRDGRVSLADLAERWGFHEVSHMSRIFRQTFGQPPGDYRNWHRLLRAEMNDGSDGSQAMGTGSLSLLGGGAFSGRAA